MRGYTHKHHHAGHRGYHGKRHWHGHGGKEGMLITAMAMVGLQADGAAAEGHGILTVVGGVFTLQRLGAA